MRSIPLLAATTVILLSVGACGDDEGGTGVPPTPTAGFTVAGPCTVGVACSFTDNSSDPQGANTITTRSWDFNGDNTEDLGGNVTAPTFIYTTEGTFQAKLTVTDNSGNTDDAIVPVTVTGGTGGGLEPIASFTSSCTGLACTFTSSSTDDGTIVSEGWDFGELGSPTNTGSGPSATHTYAAAGTYTVTLTVTDDEGLSGSTTQSVTVTSGPTGQSCTGTSATDVTCTITLPVRSAVSITLTSEECEIGNNNVFIPPPPSDLAQSVFFNVCNLVPPQTYNLVNDAGGELILEAGQQLPIRFRRGSDPLAVAPQGQITSTSASTWEIKIDDGGNPGGPNEPDFQDVVLTVTATPR